MGVCTYGTKPAHLIHDTAPHSVRAVASKGSTEPCYFLATELLQPEQIPQAFQALKYRIKVADTDCIFPMTPWKNGVLDTI